MTDNTWIDPFTSIRKDTLAELNANYEAALARAEAAEAQLKAANHALLGYAARCQHLAARVAELKEEREWRPGYPTRAGDYVVRRADGAINEGRYYADGHHWGPFNSDIVSWAYMPQEPTS